MLAGLVLHLVAGVAGHGDDALMGTWLYNGLELLAATVVAQRTHLLAGEPQLNFMIVPIMDMVVFAALAALHLLLKIRDEEKMMLEQFADEYRDYMKRTGRLLPGWSDCLVIITT